MSGNRASLVLVDGESSGDVAAIVTGDFDASFVADFDKAVASVAATADRMIVDLRPAGVVDSAALGALIRLRRKMDDRGRTVEVWIERDDQERLMRISGLWAHLGVQRVDPR